MTKFRLAFLLLIQFTLVTFAFGQGVAISRGESITLGHTVSIASATLGEEREIYISLPDGYQESSESYPVVYVLDAEELGNFQLVRGILGAFDTDGLVPETIVVGIVNTVGPEGVNRTRDFTPTLSENGQGGGAEAFYQFITEEVQPYVNAEYRINPFSILIGHSMSGHFVLHALLSGTDAFDAYIAISPAVWWNDGELIARAKELIETGYVFDNKFLFMSLADEEPSDTHEGFVEVLNYMKPGGLDFSFMEFPEDSHGTTRVRGIYYGIRYIYEGWVAPSYISSLDELLSHYKNLSEKYGYQIEIPHMEMRIQAQNILLNNSNDGEEILKTYSYLRDNYPETAETYAGLSGGLRRLGQIDEAYTLLLQAIDMAEEEQHPFLVYYLEAREELEKLISDREGLD